MRIPNLTRLTVCLILATPQAYLKADAETTRKQVQALYDTLAALLIPQPKKGPDGQQPKVKTMLVLANPAQSIPVAPQAQPASSSDGDDADDGSGDDGSSAGGSSDARVAQYQANAYIMADRLMEAVPQYNPRGNMTLSGTSYENILNHSKLLAGEKDYTDRDLATFLKANILVTGALPRNPDGTRMSTDQINALNGRLPEEDRIAIPSDEDRIGNKRDFKAWLKARAVYSAKMHDFEMAKRDRAPGASKRFYKAQDAWHTAQDEWTTHQADTTRYEAALETIRTWNNGSPAVWFYNLNQTYNDYPRMDSRYGGAKPVVFIPDVLEWNPPKSSGDDDDDDGSSDDGSSGGGDGWSQFSFSQEDYNQHQENHSSSTSASASFSYDGFHGSASYSKTHMDASDLTRSNAFTLSMEIKRVEIWRPWLDDNLWNNPVWQPTKGTALYGKVISWGDAILNGAESAAYPLPLAPLVPTTFILARNIKLIVNSATTFNAQEANTLSTSVSAGWGPIDFSYDHESADGSEDHDKKKNRAEFSSKGVTLLGFVGEALDRSPALPGSKP